MIRISESESRVMEALWREHPLDSGEIVRQVAPAEGWSPKTVRTLLERLVAKGALARRKHGRVYVYEPRIERAEWLQDQAEQLVGTHCGGRLAPLVAAFAAGDRLSEADRREIMQLLEKMK